ncbi:hypothetical protein K432DRAFT_388294 [Lepidopterella palustris CBS 459.81]|uniref:Uncharacterized protein n=1 Tax=Lepidopterella palustris CBS 459.81 TaxID=1314670 RepID=A0A8E2JK94_9PEZI|nr:hypothetical protein K432DRAFT_388294 [Lepidopterella palustris CBS 459.81]
MFRSSPILQKRIEKRLRGYRTPAYRILQSAIKSIHPTARRTRRIGDPPLQSLYTSEWGCLLPPPGQEESRSSNRKASYNGTIQYLALQDGLNKTNVPDILKKYIEKGSPARTRQLLVFNQCRSPPFTPAVEGAFGYSPPATEQWSHSIYAYNKSSIKSLPATALNARRLLKAYFNMTPHGFGDVLGKICRTGHQSFHIPFRRLCAAQPSIQFKHYSSGQVRIMVFVYDRRLETLRQWLRNCALRLLRTSV